MLGALGGGCRVPLGAWGRLDGDGLLLLGLVASPDGSRVFQAQEQGPAESPSEMSRHVGTAEELGQRLAQRLLALGAEAIISTQVP